MSAWQVAGFLGCVVLASCAQAITGFAMALVLLGLASLLELAPLPEAANVATILSLTSAVVALRGPARRGIDASILRSTGAGSVVGVGLGVALLGWLSGSVLMVLRLLLGLTIIACAIVVLRRTQPLPQRSSTRSFALFGALSGLLGGLFAASGPPLVYQLYRQPMAMEPLRDTLIAALAVSSVLRLAMVVGSGQFSASAAVLACISAPLSIAVTWLLRRHPPPLSRVVVLRLVCVLLVFTGFGLVGPSLRAIAATIAA